MRPSRKNYKQDLKTRLLISFRRKWRTGRRNWKRRLRSKNNISFTETAKTMKAVEYNL